MSDLFLKLLLIFHIKSTFSIQCFNCSSSWRDWGNHCAGSFVKPLQIFNNSRHQLTPCSKENAVCFVRSWSARDKYAWLVQRGCYHSDHQDQLMQTLNTPTRAMTCRTQRLANAENTVCLCRADWCNISARQKSLHVKLFFLFFPLFSLLNVK